MFYESSKMYDDVVRCSGVITHHSVRYYVLKGQGQGQVRVIIPPVVLRSVVLV